MTLALSAEALGVRTKACRRLLDAWLDWRGDRPLPRYADRDPVTIAAILPMVGIVDVRERGTAIMRLAGSGLREIYGFDPTGGNLIELTAPEHRLSRAYRLHVPATLPCGYLGESQYTYTDGVADWFESIGLPLQAGNGENRRSLIIFTIQSVHGRRWQRSANATIQNRQTVFRFIDIGTGAPPTIDPPGNFLDS